MRILIICENSIDRSELHFMSSLPARGVKVDVILGPASPDGSRLEAAGVRVTSLQIRSRVDIAAIRRIRDMLGGGTYDVVHCLGGHKQIAAALLASRGMPIKTIAYRGTMGHLHRLDPSSWLSYLNPRISRIVCASQAVRDYLAGLRIPPDRLAVIYKGHDVSWYQPHPRSALEEFGIPANAFVAGCAARIRPLKGVGVLLEALRRMPQDSNSHVLLAGDVDDPDVSRLSGEPDLRPLVHVAGHRADAASLMGACDAFVMPSLRREGMPRAVIEAMAQGVPPVVSRVGGMPELVEDGVCGRVVAAADPQALADALDLLRVDPDARRAMGAHAKEKIETTFSIQQTIEQTHALYEELAG